MGRFACTARDNLSTGCLGFDGNVKQYKAYLGWPSSLQPLSMLTFESESKEGRFIRARSSVMNRAVYEVLVDCFEAPSLDSPFPSQPQVSHNDNSHVGV